MQEGKCVYYSQGVMERVYATRIAQGKCAAGWTGPMCSVPVDHVGHTIMASIQNPHTGLWSAPAAFLVVDCSQAVDLPRHLAEGLVLEVSYETAQACGFIDEGTTKARVELMTGIPGAPAMVDIRAQLPTANPQNRPARRALSRIRIISVHYDAQPRPTAPYDELARLKGQANYHIGKDWNVPHGVYGFGLMYHYDIGGDGTIYWCNDLEQPLWNVTNANPIACAVKLSCGDGQEPTAAQLASLRLLVEWLRSLLGVPLSQVYGHGELVAYGNSTRCPGAALAWVKEYRRGGQPMPEPTPGPQNPDANGYFQATAHSIGGAIGAYWRAEGGVGEFGYPLTQEYTDTLEDGNVWTVQLFERALLQWRPGEPVSRARIGFMYQRACEGGHDCACG